MDYKINLKNVANLPDNPENRNESWIIAVAIIFMVVGLTGFIAFLLLLILRRDTSKNLYAAFSGSIIAGAALTLTGFTQILVFVHRRSDEKEKRFQKTLSDYNDFYVKDWFWNENVYLVLINVYKRMKIGLSYKIDNENLVITVKENNNDIKKEDDFITTYDACVYSELMDNNLFGINLIKKYNLNIDDLEKIKDGNNDDGVLLNEAFKFEYKKTTSFIEKILRNYLFSYYDLELYKQCMENNNLDITKSLIAYYIILQCRDLKFSNASAEIDCPIFAMYYLYKENLNGNSSNEQK